MTCSCRTWSRAPATWRSGRRRSPPPSGWPCGQTTGLSAPTVAMPTRWPGAPPWRPPWPSCSGAPPAWSAQYRGSGQVAVCFFGDGATNIGAFHEALNLAATWQLPVVFCCENNLYMEYTPIASVTAVPRPAADRAAAYGLEAVAVDGNDADVMYQTAVAALRRARGGGGPSLIEAATYRKGGHSRADPANYRPDDEVAAWMARDPLA